MVIVKRKPLNLWGAVTCRYHRRIQGHDPAFLQEEGDDAVSREMGRASYRGAPYLVKDQEGNTKCVSCQLCEFVCPPKAIKIIPPGPDKLVADRPNAEKMPLEFEINMLRCIFCGFCQEVCPEEAIFLLKDYSLTGTSREEMIYNKEKLLALGGVHAGVQKCKHKAEEAKEQETFPVKV
jgi:NADH-quinone oxidoreductase subunit I